MSWYWRTWLISTKTNQFLFYLWQFVLKNFTLNLTLLSESLMPYCHPRGHKLIITARKRSLGQGNIFTPVCHSVHKGRVCLVVGVVHGCQGGMCGCRGEGACMVARACMVAGECVWLLGASVVAGGHAWLPGGHVWLGACMVAGGACIGYTTRYGQGAGGTHPTGIHSCLIFFYLPFL